MPDRRTVNIIVKHINHVLYCLLLTWNMAHVFLTKNIMITYWKHHLCASDYLEAIETILSFTKNAEELLRRKKVHRDLIFKYLAKEGVAMPPSSDKHQLVTKTLELWSSGKVRTGGQFGLTLYIQYGLSELCLGTMVTPRAKNRKAATQETRKSTVKH